MNRGVLYIATGEACYREAVKSAKSLRAHNKALCLALFSDRESVDPVFDIYEQIQDPMFSTFDKVRYLWKTPFNETLYLDSDTFVTADLEPMFSSLKYCDFLGALAHGADSPRSAYAEVPGCLWEINGGVLLFKRTDAVQKMLASWYDEYKRVKELMKASPYGGKRYERDQPSLRHLVWQSSGVRVGILPPEYNFLRYFGSVAWGKALIVHGRGNIEEVAEQVNRYTGNRIYLQGGGVFQDFYELSFAKSFFQLTRLNLAFLIWHFRRLFKRI
jgi:hypothetical protein